MHKLTIEDLAHNKGNEPHMLKHKFLEELNMFITQLEKGKRLDYNFLMEEMTLIEIAEDENLDDELKNLFILEYYLNNPWLTTLS